MQNLLAFFAIGLALAVPGAALARLLWADHPFGWLLAPLLGSAYWAIGITLLPFPGWGLPALTIIGLLLAVFAWRRRRSEPGGVAAAVGPWPLLFLAPYVALLFLEVAPEGQDMAMHAMNGEGIRSAMGVPEDGRPLFPEHPPVSSARGFAAILGVGAWLGGTTAAAAAVAMSVWSYWCLHLGTTLLCAAMLPLRRAVLVAMAVTWLGKNIHVVYGWGGTPSVYSLGLLCAAVGIGLRASAPSGRARWVAALLLAGAAIVHVIPVALGAYVVGWGFLVALVLFRRRALGLTRRFAVMGAMALLLLLPYLLTNDTSLREVEEWLRAWQLRNIHPIPTDEGLGAYLEGLWKYMRRSVFRLSWLLLAVAVPTLFLLGRRWVAAAVLLPLAVPILVMNERVWWLPLSPLLYPERALYLLIPVIALIVAAAVHGLSERYPRWIRYLGLVMVMVLAFGPVRRWELFRDLVTASDMTEADLRAFEWARAHLDAETTVFSSTYQENGVWLPALSNLPTLNAHIHITRTRAFELTTMKRPVTHAWCTRLADGSYESLSRLGLAEDRARSLLFENDRVRIFRLD